MRTIAIGLCVLAACGDDGQDLPDANAPGDAGPDAMPREVVMQTQALQPGELVEGIMTSGPGDAAHIVLSAPFPDMSWNIHGHAGAGTQVVYEEFDQLTADYVFRPTSQARWYLLVRNDGTTAMEVAVTVEIHGEMQWAWQ